MCPFVSVGSLVSELVRDGSTTHPDLRPTLARGGHGLPAVSQGRCGSQGPGIICFLGFWFRAIALIPKLQSNKQTPGELNEAEKLNAAARAHLLPRKKAVCVHALVFMILTFSTCVIV